MLFVMQKVLEDGSVRKSFIRWEKRYMVENALGEL